MILHEYGLTKIQKVLRIMSKLSLRNKKLEEYTIGLINKYENNESTKAAILLNNKT